MSQSAYYKRWKRWNLSSSLLLSTVVLCVGLLTLLWLNNKKSVIVNVNNQIDVLVEDKWISNSKSGTSYLIKFSYTYNNQLNSRVVACKKKEWEMAIINQHYSAYYGLNRDGSRITKIVPIINSMY